MQKQKTMFRAIYGSDRVHFTPTKKDLDEIRLMQNLSWPQSKNAHLLADRAVQLRKRINNALEMGDVTFSCATSIHNKGGNGLYALHSLEKDTVLPYAYPGVLLTMAEHNELDAILLKLANTPADDIDIVSVCKELKENWKLSFFSPIHAESVIYWDVVYDTFGDYSFGTCDDHIIYWNEFEKSGLAHTLESSPRQACLFINEPPPYDFFVNMLTLRKQRSQENVVPEATPDGSGIQFRVTRDIAKGDEIFFHYGPKYKRDGYDVAYSKDLLDRFSTSKKINKRVREYTPIGSLFRKDRLGILELSLAISQKKIKL